MAKRGRTDSPSTKRKKRTKQTGAQQAAAGLRAFGLAPGSSKTPHHIRAAAATDAKARANPGVRTHAGLVAPTPHRTPADIAASPSVTPLPWWRPRRKKLRPPPDTADVISHAELMQVIRTNALSVPGAVNMLPADLLAAVNAALAAAGRPALAGATSPGFQVFSG